jgi:hypothetical protein
MCSVLDAGVNPRRRASNKVMMTRWRRWTWCQYREDGAMVPQHVHDEIQKLRTKTNLLELG